MAEVHEAQARMLMASGLAVCVLTAINPRTGARRYFFAPDLVGVPAHAL